jgi:two-component system nitrate/nitrite response regulator NarL
MAVPLASDAASTSDQRVDVGGPLPLPKRTARSSRSPSQSTKRGLRVPTVLIENSALFRAGLKHILAPSRFRITAEAFKLFDLAESVFSDKRCVALIGLDGDATAILSRVRSLTEEHKGLHIIILTERFRPAELLAAIDSGAEGYLLKNEISADALLQSLELVLLGVVVIPRGLTREDRVQPQLDAGPALQEPETISARGQPANAAAQTDDIGLLSPREQTVLMHLTQGVSNKHIARELNIAEATVKVHVKSLLGKIGVNNRTQAAMWAMKRGQPNGQLKQPTVGSPPGGDSDPISGA